MDSQVMDSQVISGWDHPSRPTSESCSGQCRNSRGRGINMKTEPGIFPTGCIKAINFIFDPDLEWHFWIYCKVVNKKRVAQTYIYFKNVVIMWHYPMWFLLSLLNIVSLRNTLIWKMYNLKTLCCFCKFVLHKT